MSALVLEKAKLAASWDHPGILMALAYDVEGNQFFTAGADRTLYRIDLNLDQPTLEAVGAFHESYVSGLATAGESLLSVSYDGRMVWISIHDQQAMFDIVAHQGWVRAVSVFVDGAKAVTVGDDMRVKVWETSGGRLLWQGQEHAVRTPEGFLSALYAVAVSADSRHIASADRTGSVCLWNADDGKLLHKFTAPAFYTYDSEKRSRSIGGIRSVAFSPDGSRLALSGIGQVTNVDGFVGPCRVEVWDWQAGKCVFTGEDSHKAIFNQVELRSDEVIAAGGGDGGGLMARWTFDKKEPAAKLKYKGHAQAFCFREQQVYLAGASGVQRWA